MTAAILMHADTERSADLFHAVPHVVIDPFTYIETGDRRAAVTSVLERDNLADAGVETIDIAELGYDELVGEGREPLEIDAELALRACRRFGVARASVPGDFPLGVADHLRAHGVQLDVDEATFIARRRVKTAAELAGIRRAQAAADAAMGVAARLIAELPADLTSEAVRAAMQAACEPLDCTLGDDVIVAHGAQSAVGHDSGSGPLRAGEPVVVDIWPRDRASRCWADMTRTFVAGAGPAPEELERYWRLVRESLELVLPEIRPGAAAAELFARSCEPFHAAGIPTQLSKAPGTVLEDGYYHSLGHGVGLEIHERPFVGRGRDTLLAGDVITLEPGCYRRGFGGCRLEDLVLLTEDGCENLTRFPYELAP